MGGIIPSNGGNCTGATGATTVLQLQAVSRSYNGVRVLDPVSFGVEAGTRTVVTGRNGSGKSTLLRIAAGLLSPSTGSRECSGKAVYLASGSGARVRERASQAVSSAAALSGRRLGAAQVAASLEAVGLPGPTGRQPVGSLSSGQRARVTLAIALAVDVDVVCLDEPSAHLDDAGTQTVAAVLDELARLGRTVVLATHDRVLARVRADAHIALEHGAVVAP